MKFYSCKIRLGGKADNEVRKDKVSAPEVVILRVIHGTDAVSEVEEVGKEKMEHAPERERLQHEYGSGLRRLGATMASLFGPEFQDLPTEAPGLPSAKPIRRQRSADPNEAAGLMG